MRTNSLGMVLAVALSWYMWGNVGWAIVNGFFGWGYVIYWLVYYWR